MSENNGNSRSVIIVLAILMGLFAMSTLYFWNKSRSLGTTAEVLEVKSDSLESVKFDLLDEIDSLQTAYQLIVSGNDSLSVSLSAAMANIASQNEELKAIRRSAANNKEGLTRQINQLQALKADLEGNIARLVEENEALRTENERLNVAVTEAEERNQSLTTKAGELEDANLRLQQDVSQLRAESVKASGFLVNVGNRRDKPTAKSRYVRNINVGFDMVGVPEEHQGSQTLYLVITDANGLPIPDENPIKKRIDVRGRIAEITAQASQQVVLREAQRLQFNHEVTDRLRAGTYQVAIYSDMGLLGNSSFSLR